MKLHLHAHCRTGPSAILPHAALLASSRGQLRAPCQPRSCLLCGVTLVHPTPYASGFIPMRQAARAFPISTFYAVPLQSAPVSDNPPGVSLNLLCATIPSPLASRFSPARAPPVPPQCTTCLTAHAASFHSCHTCTASRGSSTGTPSNAAAPPAHSNSICADTRDGDRELLLGARVFAF